MRWAWKQIGEYEPPYIGDLSSWELGMYSAFLMNWLSLLYKRVVNFTVGFDGIGKTGILQ